MAIHSIGGTVEAGNYSYYVLKYNGPIVLTLDSQEGDADLYISEKFDHPTYDLEEHSMASYSCGIESLYIPKSFGRPVNIGVYGHPRFEQSHFILTADFLPEEEEMDLFQAFKDPLEEKTPHAQYSYEPDSASETTNYSSIMRTTFYYLLEILIEILTAL